MINGRCGTNESWVGGGVVWLDMSEATAALSAMVPPARPESAQGNGTTSHSVRVRANAQNSAAVKNEVSAKGEQPGNADQDPSQSQSRFALRKRISVREKAATEKAKVRTVFNCSVPVCKTQW